MKIERKENMYIRYKDFDDTPKIAKIVNIIPSDDNVKDNYYWLDTNDVCLENDIIGEPSYDIISLIEVGDYVNGKKVSSIGRDAIYFGSNAEYILKSKNKDIKSVLTHEQIEREVYKI